jgi:hypothetical protein
MAAIGLVRPQPVEEVALPITTKSAETTVETGNVVGVAIRNIAALKSIGKPKWELWRTAKTAVIGMVQRQPAKGDAPMVSKKLNLAKKGTGTIAGQATRNTAAQSSH